MLTLKRLLLSLFVCFSISTSALARLGETKAEIQSRYGTGKSFKEQQIPIAQQLLSDLRIEELSDEYPRIDGCAYLKENWAVLVIFLDGKSVCERYYKTNSFKLEQEEVDQFLKINAGGKTWQSTGDTNDHYNLNWKLKGEVDSQQKDYAVANLGGQRLTVTTQALDDYIYEVQSKAAEQRQKQKSKALKDF